MAIVVLGSCGGLGRAITLELRDQFPEKRIMALFRQAETEPFTLLISFAFSLGVSLNWIRDVMKCKENIMLYILAILFPPIAILLTGKIFQAIFNAIIAVVGVVVLVFSLGALGAIYLIAIIHAIIAVHDYRKTKRDERLIKSARGD